MHVQVNLFASLRLIFGFSISLFMILLSLVSNLVLNMTNVFVVTPWFYKLLLKNKIASYKLVILLCTNKI